MFDLRMDFVGDFSLPPTRMNLKGAYAKKKFVATWIDNMGTGIMFMEGSYDPAAKAFTYTAEEEMIPGMKMKVREVVKIVDANHHTLEWFEDRGGKEVKTMEINYTRAGKK